MGATSGTLSESSAALPTGKQLALLAYLSTYPSVPQPRERLMTLLWGSHFDVQSRQNLRKSLSRLRQVVGEDMLAIDDAHVTLRPGVLSFDAVRFEALASGDWAELKVAAALYHGEFLPGLRIEQDSWAEWLAARRRRLEGLAVGVFARLAAIALAEDDAVRAEALAMRAVALDPLREDACRVMMSAMAKTGRRTEALRLYSSFEGTLKRDLQAEPDAETRALVDAIRQVGAGAPPAYHLPASALMQAGKASICVLPLRCDNPSEDYFADGMVDELTAALARRRWLFVISSRSSFTYKGRALDTREIGRELGVRYLLEGRVRTSGGLVRISTQLVEADTGAAILTNRFERPMGDVFAVHDELTAAIAAAIAPGIRAVEIARARRPTASLDAYTLYLRALHDTYQMTEGSYASALGLLERATELDQGFGEAWALMVDCRIRQWVNGWWLSTAEVRAVQEEGVAAAQRAAAADPQNGSVLAALAYAFAIFQGRFTEALELVDRAIHLQPHSDDVLSYSGQVLVHAGEYDAAIALFEQARRLNPVDPRAYATLNGIAMAHFHAGRFEASERWSRLAMAERQNWNSARRYHAASLAWLGRLDEARAEVLALLQIQPNSSLARSLSNRFRHAYMYDQLIEGLRQAGLP